VEGLRRLCDSFLKEIFELEEELRETRELLDLSRDAIRSLLESAAAVPVPHSPTEKILFLLDGIDRLRPEMLARTSEIRATLERVGAVSDPTFLPEMVEKLERIYTTLSG